MKKIVSVIISVLISFCLFSVERKYESFGVDFSVPVIFESGEKNGVKAETNMTSIGFGLHAMSIYTERIGLYVDLDLVFPQTVSISGAIGGRKITVETSRSDYNSLWGMSTIMAPAIVIKQNEKMLFTISPGIHYFMLFADANTTAVSYLLGLGVNIQNSFFFGKNGYFTLGGDISYDFIGFAMSNGTTESGNTHDFLIKPQIGIGFRF